MEFLESLENAAHLTVGVVNRSHRFFDGFESILDELDGLSLVPIFHEILDGIDRLLDTAGIAGCASVVDEPAHVYCFVYGLAVSGETDPSGRSPCSLREQTLAQSIVVHGVFHQYVDECVLALFLEMCPNIICREGGLRALPSLGVGDFPPLEPRQADRHAVLAERSVSAYRAGARILQPAAFRPELHSIHLRPPHFRGDRSFVLHQGPHVPVRTVVLAALEGRDARHPPQDAPAQKLVPSNLTHMTLTPRLDFYLDLGDLKSHRLLGVLRPA